MVCKNGVNVAALRNANQIAKNKILAYGSDPWATHQWKPDDDQRSHG